MKNSDAPSYERKHYVCKEGHTGSFFHPNGAEHFEILTAMRDQHEADHPRCESALVLRASNEDAKRTLGETPHVFDLHRIRQDRATL